MNITESTSKFMMDAEKELGENVRYCITTGWANTGEWKCTWYRPEQPWENFKYHDTGRGCESSANRHIFLVDLKNKKIYCVEAPGQSGVKEVKGFATGYKTEYKF